MAVPEAVLDAYAELTPGLEVVGSVVRDTILKWCEDQGYAFIGRFKQLESLSEKLETGRYKRLLDIDDWYACTIVLPSYSHEQKALRFLRSAFLEDSVRPRNATRKPPDVFRFDSTRFIGRLAEQPGLDRPPYAAMCKFEVQLSTAFEHAWRVALHDLVYKSDDLSWQRLRLAAQLRAAVEQSDMMIDKFDSAAELVAKVDNPLSQLKVFIIETFRTLIDDGVLPIELTPQSWSRFSENFVRLIESGLGGDDPVRPSKDAVKAIDRALRAPDALPPPRSGSLFQIVVGHVQSELVPSATIDNYCLVESSELRLFQGVVSVPKPIVMLSDAT